MSESPATLGSEFGRGVFSEFSKLASFEHRGGEDESQVDLHTHGDADSGSDAGDLRLEPNPEVTGSERGTEDTTGSPFPPYSADTTLRRGRTIIRKLQEKQSKLLVMEFQEQGFNLLREMRRSELLEEARKAMPPPRGTQTFGVLQARDLRNIDPAFSASREPALLVRQNAILALLDPVTALILHNKCFIFVPDGADSVLSVLIEKLRDRNHDPDVVAMPFELRALEASLITVTNVIRAALSVLEPRIKILLAHLSRKTSSTHLDGLRRIKLDVDVTEQQIKGMRKAIADVLDSDEDMAYMYLTRLHADSTYLADGDFSEHLEVELLLESYLMELDNELARVSLLRQEIDNTESLIMLLLDSSRNRLLRLELFFSVVTMSLALGSVVAGIFGMNLDSGVEDEPGWFVGVSVFIVTSALLVMGGFFLYMSRIKL